MLTRFTNRDCQCHGGKPISSPYTFRFHSYTYCTVCLHSIGVNAAGNPCTPKQHRDAWKKLAA